MKNIAEKISGIFVDKVRFILYSNIRPKDMGHKNARVAQLVEHDLAKVGAAGSSPVSRSIVQTKRHSVECLFYLNSSPAGARRFAVSALRSLALMNEAQA